jgi:uncharacterized protein YuzE
MKYDPKADTLTIALGPDMPHYFDTFDYQAGDVTVTIDEQDGLVKLTISNAKRFVAQAINAGVEVEGALATNPLQTGMVWYDADSSMISAYGYDQVEGILDVAFHRTGVYRYFDVPHHVFEGLHEASSKGSYMRDMIIDMYPYEKKGGRSRRA